MLSLRGNCHLNITFILAHCYAHIHINHFIYVYFILVSAIVLNKILLHTVLKLFKNIRFKTSLDK